MAGRSWDASYQDGLAPWEFGGPQPVVVELAAAGAFTGWVLDAGCGSGDNALHIASYGVPVFGVDLAETALARAREKAVERGLKAEFATADALHLEELGRRFDTILDCGLFHTFDAAERDRYVASLTSVAEPGATLYVLCFGDEDPEGVPHPVSEELLRTSFGTGSGWTLLAVEPRRLETRIHANGAPAWLATARRN
ncbi:class I SAM-dependent methyltransferase [Kribbella sp. NPDC054772]